MEYWTTVGTAIAGLMIARTMFQEYLPQRFRSFFARFINRFIGFFSPHIEITFQELTGERLKRSEAYSAIQSYLSAECCASAKRLKADIFKGSQSIILSMDDHEEVYDVFQGIRVMWFSCKTTPKNPSVSFYPSETERRYFTLTFHRDHRDTITKSYIPYVLEEGKAIAFKNRQRKLYTNNPSSNWYSYKPLKWSHVPFEHPASFDTLAMPKKEKESIKKDLLKFSKGQEYYNKIGKPWKRGYLLYGPPGTGKSTMIAAMANFLSYDVYDLELTTVKDNSELRKLLIETTSKSIIVVEDIDCSLHLTGQRAKKEEEKVEEEEEDPDKKVIKEMERRLRVTAK
ncbi:unnamed protein product [Bemisia tabaci]|uniref:Uncharacterized protein n=1 Tax=Bemisia tabaci TaxID=7038 RepID=A0A9P0F1C7_BEMTA|nr:unnamed protein product [Bemisia tabaci]